MSYDSVREARGQLTTCRMIPRAKIRVSSVEPIIESQDLTATIIWNRSEISITNPISATAKSRTLSVKEDCT